MNFLIGPGCFLTCDGRFQVYDSEIDRSPFQFLQGVAPDVIEAHRPRNWAVGFLGKSDVFARVANVRFVQNRIDRMRQRLIDAAPGHDIAAEKQAERHDQK